MTTEHAAEEVISLDQLPDDALALHIADAALDKKALDLVVIDVRGRASYTDFIVVCTARNDRHCAAIADYIAETLYPLGIRPKSIEGKQHGQWVLADYGDVIAHIFYAPYRRTYDIEQLWAEAPRLDLEIPEDLRANPSIYDGYEID